MMNKLAVSAWIKKRGHEMGFSRVGIAQVEALTEEGQRLQEWLNRGYHGDMGYMANHFEKRKDPSLLVEGSRSVIVVAYNYFPR
ncbi:MAG TPA: hypothetical protein VKZ56_04080, partial [Membranihabitans sp.]|nr:hypothetical protein [Membranihabitans sp.]